MWEEILMITRLRRSTYMRVSLGSLCTVVCRGSITCNSALAYGILIVEKDYVQGITCSLVIYNIFPSRNVCEEDPCHYM